MRKGKSMTKKLDKMTLRKPDGSKCTTDEENAKVMGDYLSATFSQTGKFDPAAIAKVRQRDPQMYAHLADSPTDQEIDSGVSKMGMKKSGADAEIPAEFYKALARDEEASKYLRGVIRAYWESGSYRERQVPPPAPVALPAQPPAPAPPPRRSSRATAPSAASLN